MGLCKCFLYSVILSVISAALLILIPNLPPYCEVSKPISVPKIKPLVGKLALNEKLKEVEIWLKGKVSGPEAFAEYNGELYASLHGGIVAKLVDNQVIPVAKTGKPCKGYYEEKICGRPLGIKFDKNGLLYVADAYYGVLRFDIKTGKKEVIISPDVKINGKTPKIFNSIALASNGDIYWTDSSTQFQLENLVFDLLADPTGRLIHYDAKTKTNKVLIDNLHFANGVVLSEDEDFVIVAETMYNRIYRYYLKGPKAGTKDVFIDGLPGFPDNLQTDGAGGFLVPLVEAVDEEHPNLVQMWYQFPLVRKLFLRIFGLVEFALENLHSYYPTEFGDKALFIMGHYSFIAYFKMGAPHQTILRLSKNGEILENLSTSDKKLRIVSEAFVHKDHLYLGSPYNDYIGRIPLSKVGWETLRVKRTVPVEKPTLEKQHIPPPPKATTPPSKQQTTTPPPKKTTPKQQTTTPPPKQTTPPPPKQTTPPPPKQTTPPPPKQTAPPPPKQTTPPPPKQQTTPPTPKQQTTPSPPKQQAPPPSKQQTPSTKQQKIPSVINAKNEL